MIDRVSDRGHGYASYGATSHRAVAEQANGNASAACLQQSALGQGLENSIQSLCRHDRYSWRCLRKFVLCARTRHFDPRCGRGPNADPGQPGQMSLRPSSRDAANLHQRVEGST